MHFGYAFCIGCTLLYHSGIFRKNFEKGEVQKSNVWKFFYAMIGLGYPALILTTIVATANHYFMDAMMSTIFVCIAFGCNEVFYAFLPLEDWFLWLLRVEKPVPTTGDHFRQQGLTL